jgi:Asp-tRNA(Asn)/Glu-tRNA(Gln) amidotransferase C subunit
MSYNYKENIFRYKISYSDLEGGSTHNTIEDVDKNIYFFTNQSVWNSEEDLKYEQTKPLKINTKYLKMSEFINQLFVKDNEEEFYNEEISLKFEKKYEEIDEIFDLIFNVFCQRYQNSTYPEINFDKFKLEQEQKFENIFTEANDEWILEFMNDNKNLLNKILERAKFLNIEPLVDIITLYIASEINNLTEENMKQVFNIHENHNFTREDEVDFLINLDSIIKYASEEEKQQIKNIERQIEDSEDSTSSSTTNKKIIKLKLGKNYKKNNQGKSLSAQKSKWKKEEKVKIVPKFKDSEDATNLEDSEDEMNLESSKYNEDAMTLENSKDAIGETKDINLLKKEISGQIIERLRTENINVIEDIFEINQHINSIYLFPYIYIDFHKLIEIICSYGSEEEIKNIAYYSGRIKFYESEKNRIPSMEELELNLPVIDFDNEIEEFKQKEKIVIDKIIDNLNFSNVFNRHKYPYNYDQSLDMLNNRDEYCENLEELRQIFSERKARSLNDVYTSGDNIEHIHEIILQANIEIVLVAIHRDANNLGLIGGSTLESWNRYKFFLLSRDKFNKDNSKITKQTNIQEIININNNIYHFDDDLLPKVMRFLK